MNYKTKQILLSLIPKTLLLITFLYLATFSPQTILNLAQLKILQIEIYKIIWATIIIYLTTTLFTAPKNNIALGKCFKQNYKANKTLPKKQIKKH